MPTETYDYEDLQKPNGNTNANHAIDVSLLDGVRSRRIMAFLLDYVIIAVLSMIAHVVVGILGILTLGLAWLLYVVLIPLVAIAYIGLTLGGPKQATPGMQFFAIKLIRLDGGRIDGFLAILHSIFFWVAHVTLTPFMLLVSLFSSKKRLIQDVLLGTVVIRSQY